eukprot:g35938.t1
MPLDCHSCCVFQCGFQLLFSLCVLRASSARLMRQCLKPYWEFCAVDRPERQLLAGENATGLRSGQPRVRFPYFFKETSSRGIVAENLTYLARVFSCVLARSSKPSHA